MIKNIIINIILIIFMTGKKKLKIYFLKQIKQMNYYIIMTYHHYHQMIIIKHGYQKQYNMLIRILLTIVDLIMEKDLYIRSHIKQPNSGLNHFYNINCNILIHTIILLIVPVIIKNLCTILYYHHH
jgi:hypothetical protein